MPIIKLKLNDQSINQALKELKAYQKKVDAAGENLTHSLTEQGVALAQLNALFMSAYDKGELVNGIESQYQGTKGYVTSTAPHSAFVCFGTGLRGAQSPHPEPGLAGWRYDVNEHGEAGWWWWKGGGGQWGAGVVARAYMCDNGREVPN